MRTPCASGTYSDPRLLPSQRRSQTACKQCPFNTTTVTTAATSLAACICAPGFFRHLTNCSAAEACQADNCTTCPAGFHCCEEHDACAKDDVNTSSARVAPGYWRPSALSAEARLCVHSTTCLGGVSPANISRGDRSSCASGFTGPYCAACENVNGSIHYLSHSTAGAICQPCQRAYIYYAYVGGGLLVTLLGIFVLGAALSYKRPSRPNADGRGSSSEQGSTEGGRGAGGSGRSRRCKQFANAMLRALRETLHSVREAMATSPSALLQLVRRACNTRLVTSIRAIVDDCTLPIKGKISLGFALVIAQLGSVYQIRLSLDSKAEIILTSSFDWLRDLLGKLPGLHLACFGISSLVHELVLYTTVPLGVIIVICAFSWAFRHSLVPALPIMLFWTYLVFPSVRASCVQHLARLQCTDDDVAFSPLAGRSLPRASALSARVTASRASSVVWNMTHACCAPTTPSHATVMTIRWSGCSECWPSWCTVWVCRSRTRFSSPRAAEQYATGSRPS